MQFHLLFRQNHINIHRFGEGKKYLLCLHGFGESGESFACLEKDFAKHYTLIAPDLPLHGNTDWRQQECQQEELRALAEAIIAKLEIDQFSLLGYSMGGRLALQLTPLLAERMEQLILIAPDGLEKNFWYRLAVHTMPGRAFLRRIVHSPSPFFRLISFCRKRRLINESLYKFAYQQMDTLEKRQQLFNVWNCFRDISPSVSRVKAVLQEYELPSILFFGEYDRVMPPALGKKFSAGLKNCEVIVLKRGHQLISSSTAPQLLKHLRKPMS